LHLAVAPVGSVLPAVAVGADFDAEAVDFAAVAAAGADCDIAPEGAGAAAGAEAPPGDAGVIGAAGTAAFAEVEGDFGAFCTPPWPLHAPLPVVAEVVPSLQVVGSAESA